MVTQPSRRAFLTGRRTPATPWGQFCARLSRTCVGQVRWDQDAQTSLAWLKPARAADVQHAQALCVEFGVQLLLLESEARPDMARPILWVDSHAPWATLEQVDPAQGLWRVDAGITLATLHQKGVGIFKDALTDAVTNASTDPLVDVSRSNQTVAQWFASPFAGNPMRSGIVQAEVLLADGTLELFGPFGASASKPLRSMSVQQKIPKLFELAQSAQATLCAQSERWPARYRLDALLPRSGDSLNLSWLFLGHGGSLGWLQTLWLKAPGGVESAEPVSACGAGLSCPDTGMLSQATLEIDQQIKLTLDPKGVFGLNPPAKGIESLHFT